MKKFLIIITALFALLAVSCTQEKIEPVTQGGYEVEVTFTAQLPEDIATKAYADGTTATQLTYAVYNAGETTPVHTLPEGVFVAVENFTANIKLNLISGKKYDFVFWAQSPDCTAYDVEFIGQTMTVDYNSIEANDEDNDAFYAFMGELLIDGAKSEKVYLKRPFAQINLGTDDLTLTEDTTFDPTTLKSSMTARVATELNLKTGAVSKEENVTFAKASIPVTSEAFRFPYSANNKTYDYLAMNYVLVSEEDGKKIVDCVFEIYEGEEENPTNTVTVANVPVQLNYRTNIYGSILTDPTDVEVEVKPDIGDGENKPVVELPAKTPNEKFYEELAKGRSITLTGDGRDKIDFSNLNGKYALAEDLILTLDAPIKEIVLGGNNETDETPELKSASAKPSITIFVGKDIAFPNFTFNGNTENYTVKGSLETNKPLDYKLVVDKANSNLKFTDIKLEGLGAFEFKAGTNVTVENCKGENLAETFVYLEAVNGCSILNNECSFAPADTKSDYGVSTYICNGNIVIDGNKFVNPSKHGIQFNDGATQTNNSVITVNNNVITGAGEDAIKADKMSYITITNNELQAMENGIRLTRLEKDAVWTITGNTIDMSLSGSEFFGIAAGDKNQASSVAVNLTVKENKPVNIPDGCYLNISSLFTLSGDYAMPYEIADGVALSTDGKTLAVSNANGLKWVADVLNREISHPLVPTPHNAGLMEGMTVKLLNDISLAGMEWTPIASKKVAEAANANGFAGTFDGNGKTITGLTVTATGENFAGLFGDIVGFGVVKNLTLKDVDVKGEWLTGAIAGNSYATVENCHVDGGTVETTSLSQHAGAIVGGALENATITGCSAKNLTVKGTWHVGGIAGAASGTSKVTGNTVEKVTVMSTQTGKDAEGFGSQVGEVVGWNVFDAATVKNNVTNENIVKIVADGITILNNKDAEISKAAGMVYANENLFSKSGYSYKLVDDIDMKDVADWSSKLKVNFTFDGNGHKISNWSTTERALFAPYTNSSFTVKNLTLESCKVNSNVDDFNGSTGLIAGTTDAQDFVTIENCKVTGNTTVNTNGNYVYSGAFVGYSSAKNINFLNCSVENATIGGTAPNSVGGFIGHTTADNTVIENATVTGCNIKGQKINKSGIVVGTIQIVASISVKDITGNTVFDEADSKAVYGRVAGGYLFMDGAATVNEGDKVSYLAYALDKGVYNINLTEGNYTMPSTAKNKTLKFTGVGNKELTVIKCAVNNTDGSLTASEVTFENLTIESYNENYRGFSEMKSATYKDCVIKNQYTLYCNSTFEDCTFTQPSKDWYNVWTYGTNPTFERCTFNCAGKSILVYHDKNATTCSLAFDTCTFIASETVAGKTAIQMHTEYGINGTLAIKESTATGFDNINEGLWNELDNGTKVETDVFDITVDGVQVH